LQVQVVYTHGSTQLAENVRVTENRAGVSRTAAKLSIDISEPVDIIEYQGELEAMAAKLRLTDLDAMGQAAECLRTLAHPHRLRMVQMLLQGEYSVGELAEACNLPTPMASEHLRLMQRCGFLTSEKQGRKVYYRVAEPHLKSILKCVEDRFGVAAARR
jgi:ArsR family transcriptional regulator, zinc-responsive transcriptional repressor